MWLRSSQRAQDKPIHDGSSNPKNAMLPLTQSINLDSRIVATTKVLNANKPKGRLSENSNKNHKSEGYDDLKSDFPREIFNSLESYLPTDMLTLSRDDKVKYMRNILLDYLPPGTRERDQKQREYRRMILSNYKPRHREIYVVDPTTFFVPTFLKAINDNTEQSIRSIVSEPAPGIFTFEMFQPHFCELLISEVENFEKWVNQTNFQVIRPNTMNKYGAVLDDFGLQPMLNKLMESFISPLSKVFYSEIGGSTLDSHHGFVVEYGTNKDIDLGFHVDDSEVTLNVCLGKQFSGGELFFRGMRCEKHLRTEAHPKEIFDYFHVPGRAVLHHGRHRHGARATTSGHRVNLLLWCRSSGFREMIKYKKEFSTCCAKCYQEKSKRLLQSIEEVESALFKKEGKQIALSVGDKRKGKEIASTVGDKRKGKEIASSVGDKCKDKKAASVDDKWKGKQIVLSDGDKWKWGLKK